MEFRNVSFRYPDAAGSVVEHVSFRAKKGQTVAFIGATGSGKSSLINLIPRFYDATEGQVLVDGVDVREYTPGLPPPKAGVCTPAGRHVFRHHHLQRGLRCRPPRHRSPGEAGSANRSGRGLCGQRRLRRPRGPGGANLSGGQKQRLAIARAVCRKPEIYIFDDSFSALDYRTDRALRQTLKRETAGVTSLIVAQRIGTIRDADQILVLDDGKVVGQGTHRELLESCEVYRQIALSQLSKEELEHA